MKWQRSMALLLALSAAGGFAWATLPQPTALFGRSWGDPVQPGMIRQDVPGHPEREIHRRPTDALVLFDVPLEAIFYVYEQGTLQGLSIQLAADQLSALAAVLDGRWGPGGPFAQGGRRWSTTTFVATLRRLPPPNEASAVLNVFPDPAASAAAPPAP